MGEWRNGQRGGDGMEPRGFGRRREEDLGDARDREQDPVGDRQRGFRIGASCFVSPEVRPSGDGAGLAERRLGVFVRATATSLSISSDRTPLHPERSEQACGGQRAGVRAYPAGPLRACVDADAVDLCSLSSALPHWERRTPTVGPSSRRIDWSPSRPELPVLRVRRRCDARGGRSRSLVKIY